MAHDHSPPLEVLLVDDDPELRKTLTEVLREAGHDVTAAGDGDAALGHVTSKVFDVVITDVRLPKLDGLLLFRRIRREAPDTRVILMTAYADVGHAVSALKEGAYDYLTKPFELDELILRLQRLGKERAMRRELAQARHLLEGRKPQTTLVGASPALRRVIGMVEMVSQSDAPTLVTGESGTGKELVARMLHERSPRYDKPFVAVNCGALAENLVEAELFGHEKGAFTGAEKKRDGRFKAADGGTIFLDEIGELPLPTQAKLLRVLQEGTFEPLGSNTSIQVDVRIISATHRNLKERIKEGIFREDLYYRINVIEIAIPPLRERRSDLTALVHHFLQRFCPPGKPVPGVTPAAWAALSHYAFPGNVRELSHAIQRAVILSGGGDLDLPHLPPQLTESSASGQTASAEPEAGARMITLESAIRSFEREYLTRAIAHTGGKKAQAAGLLGISRKTLWEKLRAFDIEAPEVEEKEAR
jgi:DNA-binding NtrC family response regulator